MDPVVPRNSIPSMAAKMQGLRVDDKAEKALLVRIGTLIDAIVAAQRGSTNAPGSVPRKANVNNLKKPKLLTGSTENIFNGASVTINASSSAINLSHYEAQLDSDPNFSAPTSKEVFTTGTTFKGLATSTQYHIRIRPVTKNGQVGEWALLDTVLTTGQTQGADFDGDNLGSVVLSKTFTFNSSTQDIFCASAVGAIDIDATHPALGTGVAINHAAIDTQVDIIDRRINGGTVPIEGITLEGVVPTVVGPVVPSGSSFSDMHLTRANPIIFFNLMQAAIGAFFPVDYTFDVQISISGGGFVSSTKDTVWVQF